MTEDLATEISLLRHEIGQFRAELSEMKEHVDDLRALKNQGLGAFFALSIFGAVILLGLKEWLRGTVA